MAQELYSFFNSSADDVRSYDADALASAMRALSLSGVGSLEDGLKIIAEGGTLRTLAAPGQAVLRGYFYELRDDGGAAMAFSHGAATGADRIDRIVVRLDGSARQIKLAMKTGTAAATPEPPALTRTAEIYELSLAQVRVRAGATAIAEGDVTDERADESVCGAALPEGARLSKIWERMSKAEATGSRAGLMSAGDKAGLDALRAALTPNATAQTLNLNGYVLEGGHLRYGEDGTVSVAIAANGQAIAALESDEADQAVHLYTHTRSEAGVHNLAGTGANGRVKITAQVQSGDRFTVNGAAAACYIGGVACDELPVGRWMTFVYTPAEAEESAQVNFKSGGWAQKGYQLLCVSDASALPASPSLPFGVRSAIAVVLDAEPVRVLLHSYGDFHNPSVIYPEPWTARRELHIVQADEDHPAAAGTAFAPRFLGRGGTLPPYEAWYDGTTGVKRRLTKLTAYTWNGAEWAAWAGNGGGIVLGKGEVLS